MKKLASILAVSSLALLGADNRAAFQALLEHLFEAREALRIPMQQTFGPANIEVALVDPNTLFIDEYMEDAFASDSGPVVSEKESPSRRVGFPWGVGLKVKKESTRKRVSMRVLNVLRTPVVLESTLEVAMKEVGRVASLEALRAGDGRP